MCKQEKLLRHMEARFLEVAGLEGDLSCISQEDNMQVKVNKEKSDTHGEVFTDLWLVDKMLDRIPPVDWKCLTRTTHDLCAGYGQFTIRMLRRRFHHLGEKLNIQEILSEYHLFSELQLSSCFRLLYVFGTSIRLLIGDVTRMGELPNRAEHGIWVYCTNGWEDKTELVTRLFNKYLGKTNLSLSERADAFESMFNKYSTRSSKRSHTNLF